MEKIEKLTPKQELRMKEVLAEWLEVGRSTHAVNREEAEAIIVEMYAKIDKPKPMFFWFPSPLQCLLGIAATKLMAKDTLELTAENNLRDNLWANLGDNLRANLWANLRTNLWDNLWDNLWTNLRDNLWANLGDNLGDNLRDNLWDNLGDNLRDNLGDNLRDNLWANLGDNLWDSNYFGGNLWCAWEVFYDFANEIGAPYTLENRRLLDTWLTQSRNCHFWWPFDNMVFMSERPASVSVDNMGRLHCENDAAIYYHDGYGLFQWHGTTVPKWVIENPEQITPEKILAESNAEVRRVMAERFGFRKFGQSLIDGGKAKLISEQNVWGEAVRYYHYNDGEATMGFIHVINGTTETDGTKREFILTVKANNDNAEQAVFSTYPELMERIKDVPDKWEIMKKSIRS